MGVGLRWVRFGWVRVRLPARRRRKKTDADKDSRAQNKISYNSFGLHARAETGRFLSLLSFSTPRAQQQQQKKNHTTSAPTLRFNRRRQVSDRWPRQNGPPSRPNHTKKQERAQPKRVNASLNQIWPGQSRKRDPSQQLAFKDSMTRGVLWFALRIAFHCVLHRFGSLGIRECWLFHRLYRFG